MKQRLILICLNLWILCGLAILNQINFACGKEEEEPPKFEREIKMLQELNEPDDNRSPVIWIPPFKESCLEANPGMDLMELAPDIDNQQCLPDVFSATFCKWEGKWGEDAGDEIFGVGLEKTIIYCDKYDDSQVYTSDLHLFKVYESLFVDIGGSKIKVSVGDRIPAPANQYCKVLATAQSKKSKEIKDSIFYIACDENPTDRILKEDYACFLDYRTLVSLINTKTPVQKICPW